MGQGKPGFLFIRQIPKSHFDHPLSMIPTTRNHCMQASYR
jgi:hypothetical protein